jgi:hypothetical protein
MIKVDLEDESLSINSFYMNKRPEINFTFMLCCSLKVRRILYLGSGCDTKIVFTHILLFFYGSICKQ